MKRRVWISVLFALLCATLLAACNGGGKYQITVQGVQGGVVSLSTSEASAGETVQVTCTPDEGFVFKEGSLKANGEPVVGSAFRMPKQDVVVTCVFLKTDLSGKTFIASLDFLHFEKETLTAGVRAQISGNYTIYDAVPYEQENLQITATVNGEEWEIEVDDGAIYRDNRRYELAKEVALSGTYAEMCDGEQDIIVREHTFASGRVTSKTYREQSSEQTEATFRLFGSFLYLEGNDPKYHACKQYGVLTEGEQYLTYRYGFFGETGFGNGTTPKGETYFYRKNDCEIALKENGAYAFGGFVGGSSDISAETERYDFLFFSDGKITLSHNGVPFDTGWHFFGEDASFVRVGNAIKVFYSLDGKELALIFHIFDENTLYLKDTLKSVQKFVFQENCDFAGGCGEPFTSADSDVFFTHFYEDGVFGERWYDNGTDALTAVIRTEIRGAYKVYGGFVVRTTGDAGARTVRIGIAEKADPATSEHGCNYYLYYKTVEWTGASESLIQTERIWNEFGGWQ